VFDRRGPVGFRRLLAGFDRCAVAGDRSDQAIRILAFRQFGWPAIGHAWRAPTDREGRQRNAGWVSLISASCSLDGRALAAKAAKARENVDSLGTSPARCQPHKRRRVLSADSISINRLVVGKLNTALAKKARASIARSAGGRPGSPGQQGRNASIRTIPRTLTSCLWCPLSGPQVVSSSQGRSSS
jgi:hypothetical protein